MRAPAGFLIALLCGAVAAGAEPPHGPVAASAPHGPRAAIPEARPEGARLAGCSLREGVCVHAAPGVSDAAVAQALDAAESAFFTYRALDMPPPAADGALGGGPQFDLYLHPGDASRAMADAPLLASRHDQASAFGIVGVGRRHRCGLASDVARVVAQAALLRIDAAQHESSLAIGSSQLAALVAPCPPLEAEAVDRLQRRPELALTRASASRFEGAFLFASYLDDMYGRGTPGRLWPSLIAIGSQRTPPESPVWHDEPDVLDDLQRLLVARGSGLDDALLGFAVARAFVGSRSDGAHLADVDRFGDLGRPRFGFAVELASLPRRLALRPTEPTGAAFVWLDTAGATERDRLTLIAECEASRAFRWSLVTIDAGGRELGRHDAGRWGEQRVVVTLERLTEAAAVLVVGAALGPDNRTHPFDPDDGEPIAAGCEVTLRGAEP